MTSTRVRALRSVAATATLAALVAACSGGGSTASPAASASASPVVSDAASPSASMVSPSASPVSPSASTGAVTTITGVEYRFDGVPATVTTGTTFQLTNGGQEAHEMVVVRRNDGVTESWQELVAMPQEEVLQKVAFLGAPIANPGETAPETVVIDQPGSYAMLCFIPTGMTEVPESLDPNASLPTGAPHFTQGMLAEFEVAS